MRDKKGEFVKRSVCMVLTARASYTKFKPVFVHLRDNPAVELKLVCAASAVLDRFGNVASVVREDGFEIDEELHFLIEGENILTTCKSTGMGLIEFAGAFDRLKPDLVAVMADRYEVLPAAIAAAYQNIPLAHIQGGEVSGNIDEKVRHAITKLADYHFAATERARDWLIRMGEIPERVYHTGCPSVDIAAEVVADPALDFDIYERYRGVGHCPDPSNGYIIVMQHPVTDEIEYEAYNVEQTLLAVANLETPVFWFWPNADAGSEDVAKTVRRFREREDPKHIHFFKNMKPRDFLRFLYNSKGIVGNSSAAIREASFLGVPAINLGTRQRNRERGPNVLDVPHDHRAIRAAIESHFAAHKPRSTIYGDGQAGKRIADLLATVELVSSKELNYLNA